MKNKGKLYKRIVTGMLCFAMLFTIVFSYVDVKADVDDTITVTVNVYDYNQVSDSSFYKQDVDVSTMLMPSSSTDEEIIEAVKAKLPQGKNLSDTIAFKEWDVKISGTSSTYNGTEQTIIGKRVSVYPTYVDNSSWYLFRINVVYVAKSSHTPSAWSITEEGYYAEECNGVIIKNQLSDTISNDDITTEVNKVFNDKIISGAAFKGWTVESNNGSSATVKTEYNNVFNTLSIKYAGKYDGYDGMHSIYDTYMSDDEPADNDIANHIKDLNLIHLTDCKGWECKSQNDGSLNRADKKRNHELLSCLNYVYAEAQYDSYPCVVRYICVDKEGNTYSKMVKDYDELYPADMTINQLLDIIKQDEKINADADFKVEINAYDAAVSVDENISSFNKKCGDLTIKELALEWGDGVRKISFYGIYTDKTLSIVYYPTISNDNKINTSPGMLEYISDVTNTVDEIVSYLQSINYMHSFEEYKAIDSKITGFECTVSDTSIAGIAGKCWTITCSYSDNGNSSQNDTTNSSGSTPSTPAGGSGASSGGSSGGSFGGGGGTSGGSDAKPDDGNKPDNSDSAPDEDNEMPDDSNTLPDTPQSDNILSIDENTGEATVKDAVMGGDAKIPVSVTQEGELYRMYDPNRGEHFYTKNAEEAAHLASIGWTHEADSDFTVISAAEEFAVPVYRVYNPNGGGMHFYTENAAEALNLRANGWNYEGISHYVYDKDSDVGTVQYRLYNPNSTIGEHNWTTNINEYNMLKNVGWVDEGICWKIK